MKKTWGVIDCPEGFLSECQRTNAVIFRNVFQVIRGIFGRRKLWAGLVVCFVAGVAIGSYRAGHQSSYPSFVLSGQQIVHDVQNPLPNQIRRNIRLVHVTHRKDKVLAFATFKVSGRRQYEGLILSSKGYDGDSLLLGSNTTLQPIQYGEMGENGFEYIIGRIFDHKDVASLLIIFSNGSAVSVVVHNGYFWYSNKMIGEKMVSVKKVIAVTKTGETIENHSTKRP